uniref:uncharacterized protein n=1 Tax=Semicossyphus pulcher TaxID=241346 RepID=UPI0037E976E2
MLLLYVTVSCFLFGSSAALRSASECYGKHYTFPFEFTPPIFRGQMYFTPRDGGSTITLMVNGEVMDPRMKRSLRSLKLTDLTERDNGIFWVSNGSGERRDAIELDIKDCADNVRKVFGEKFYYDVPHQAEVLEYAPNFSTPPNVLWNRSDPQTNVGGRGRMGHKFWEISDLTQKDKGYYNLRKEDRTLLSRILLTVEEKSMNYDKKVGENLIITYPLVTSSWTVRFTPEGDSDYTTLMASGTVLTDETPYSGPGQFDRRFRKLPNGIEINSLTMMDSGSYEFRDPDKNLGQTVWLQVQPAPPSTTAIVGIISGVAFAAILCCCCVRKCCCKKSSSKRDEAAPLAAAALQVYNHGQNRPVGSSHSTTPAPDYSYQPPNPSVSRAPAASSLRPPVNIHVNPPQPEVDPLRGQRDAPAPTFGSDYFSLDTEPRFEIKGMKAPSAPPLGSDSTVCNVYTSDKLNFLEGARHENK